MAVTELYLNQMLVKVLPCASASGDFWQTVKDGKWENETKQFYIIISVLIKIIWNWELGMGVTCMMAYANNPRKIYGIEADVANYNIFKHNVYNNHLEDKIKMFNACLTDKANSGKIISLALQMKKNQIAHHTD